MGGRKQVQPAWISALLAQPWVLPVTRLSLVSAYLLGGIGKMTDFTGATAEMARFGLHPPALWAGVALVVEILGSLAVLCNCLVWLGAGGLACLTAVAMVVVNDFWHQTGSARSMAFNGFFEHLAMVAGMVLAVLISNAQRQTEALGHRTGRIRPLFSTEDL